jgi:site-specific recombinase XerD
MPTAIELIDPFFAWKQGPNRRFAESSRIKYEPQLRHFAAWCSDRDVAELTTALIEFEYLPTWTIAFEERNGRKPKQNTVRLAHNTLSSFLDYVWRRGLTATNPMLAIVRPPHEQRLNDWLSAEEDEAMATVRMTPLEDIVCGLGLRAVADVDHRSDRWQTPLEPT